MLAGITTVVLDAANRPRRQVMVQGTTGDADAAFTVFGTHRFPLSLE